jgi:hypothetical protein
MPERLPPLSFNMWLIPYYFLNLLRPNPASPTSPAPISFWLHLLQICKGIGQGIGSRAQRYLDMLLGSMWETEGPRDQLSANRLDDCNPATPESRQLLYYMMLNQGPLPSVI